MSEKFWPVPCCRVTWPTERDYERHVHQQHTREQILDLLVEAAQKLARQQHTTGRLTADVHALQASLRDGEAAYAAVLHEFDEWRDKAQRRLMLRDTAERVARVSAGLNERLAQRPETD